MATPYFSLVPDIYITRLENDNETRSTVLVKNLFRKTRTRTDLAKYFTLFNPYYVRDGQMPWQVATELYNDAQLEWVILLINNIVNVYNDWPKSNDELVRYVQEKYASAGIMNPGDELHHYETQEVYEDNILVLEGGIRVNSDFTFRTPKGVLLTDSNVLTAITNYEYETQQNEKKRLIYILNSSNIDAFIAEFERLINYKDNDELDVEGNKLTPVSSVEEYLN